MVAMTAADRTKARQGFTDELGNARESIAITKPDLIAAAAAVDQWVSDNAAAFNSAIPLPARTGLTAPQKARLLMHVVRQRFAVGA